MITHVASNGVRFIIAPVLFAVIFTLSRPISGQDDCAELPGLECEATDDQSYPVTISWTNDDPEETYEQHEVLRNGEVIATLEGGSDDEYTDASGPGGQLLYEVRALDARGECLASSPIPCHVVVGALRTCASLFDFEETDFGGGADGEEFTLDTIECGFQYIDGVTDDDLSPMEDDRLDVLDLVVELVLTTTDVGGFTFTLTSPEGTEVTLWDGDGEDVEWDEQTLMLSDAGEAIPDSVPEACDDCFFTVAGPGELGDFFAEDATGEWTLEATATVESTLHDWCILIVPDEWAEFDRAWIRGDIDGNGSVSAVIDAFRLLQWVFGDADEPPCQKSADVNGDGEISPLVDALYLLAHFFGDGETIPEPFPDCGGAEECSDLQTLTCVTPNSCP